MTSVTDARRRARPRHLADRLILSEGSHGVVRATSDVYPRRGWLRWLLRLVYALPYAAVAVLTNDMPLHAASANRATVEHLLSIDWSRADAQWASDLYPPVGMIAAWVATHLVGETELGVSLLGAIVAGYMVQKVLEGMHRRRFGPVTQLLFVVAVAANPLTFYLVDQSSLLFLALTFFALGVSDMLRFLWWSSTRDGFRAGLLFMLSALNDPMGLTFVATALAASPFLLPRTAVEPRRRLANALVLGFPTVGGHAIWLFLEASFGSTLPALFGQLGSGAGGRLTAIADFLAGPGGLLLIVPVVAAAAVAVLLNRPSVIALIVAVATVYELGIILGFGVPSSELGICLVLLPLLISFIPAVRTRAMNLALPLIAAAFAVAVWVAWLGNPLVAGWWHALGVTIGLVHA